MHSLIRKLHFYAGLFTFSALVVYGIAGLTASALPPPDVEERPSSVEFRDFTTPAGATDKAVADAVHAFLQPPLAEPIPEWAVRRNSGHNLQLDFYSPNGMTRVIVLEKERRLRIEHARDSIWGFLNTLHSITLSRGSSDLALNLWRWYNEMALWTLSGMALSGVYLWLASRPGWRPAQLTFAAGLAIFLALYALTR